MTARPAHVIASVIDNSVVIAVVGKTAGTHGLRFYIFTDQGLRRISTKTVLEARALLPQFAGTRQKMVQAVTEHRNRELFFSALGTYGHFDEHGRFYVPKKACDARLNFSRPLKRLRTNGGTIRVS